MMPNLPVLRPYSVSTPMIATITSSRLKLSLARFRVAWCCSQKRCRQRCDVRSGSVRGNVPRTLQFGDRRRADGLEHRFIGMQAREAALEEVGIKAVLFLHLGNERDDLRILREGRFPLPLLPALAGAANRAVATGRRKRKACSRTLSG